MLSVSNLPTVVEKPRCLSRVECLQRVQQAPVGNKKTFLYLVIAEIEEWTSWHFLFQTRNSNFKTEISLSPLVSDLSGNSISPKTCLKTLQPIFFHEIKIGADESSRVS